MLKLKSGDEKILDSLLEEIGREDKCKNNILETCQLCSTRAVLEKMEILSMENEMNISLFIIANGLLPLLSNFFLLGLKFAAMQKDCGELEKMFKED